VLMGATTMKGILCLAARTAALYVPICFVIRFVETMELTHVRDMLEQFLEKRTLFAVSPFFAILSAPTTFGNARQILKFSDESDAQRTHRQRVCHDAGRVSPPWYRRS